jgi:hypothetical protein
LLETALAIDPRRVHLARARGAGRGAAGQGDPHVSRGADARAQ